MGLHQPGAPPEGGDQIIGPADVNLQTGHRDIHDRTVGQDGGVANPESRCFTFAQETGNVSPVAAFGGSGPVTVQNRAWTRKSGGQPADVDRLVRGY